MLPAGQVVGEYEVYSRDLYDTIRYDRRD